MSADKCKLSVFSFGMALGLTWGLGVFLLGLIAMWLKWGTLVVTTIGSAYVGFEPTLAGVFIGLLWGFIDGFIAGVIFSWLYNLFCGRCCKKE